jgi:hypothetical protein
MKLINHNLHRLSKQITQIFILLFLLYPMTYDLSPMTSNAYASIPRLINYQGKLTNSQGQPITGTVAVTFRIYDVESGGSPLWSESYPSLTIDKGIFNVLLGGTKPNGIDLTFNVPYYLGIQVGSDPEMTPRQRLASSAYAFTAENAEKLNGSPASSFASSSHNHDASNIVSGKISGDRLKAYDSGWFQATVAHQYTLQHNLGTTKLLISLYCADDSNGTNMFQVIMDLRQDGTSSMFISQIQNITPMQLTVFTGNRAIGARLKTNGEWHTVDITNAYLRVIALSLE